MKIEKKNTPLNSKAKIDKKLDDLKIVQSNKQAEISKLTFELNL